MVAGALLLSASTAQALELSGQAVAIDGDTLEVVGHRVRLWGIDALELAQTCGRTDGARWPCGQFAKDALYRLVWGARVVCNSVGDPDRYGRDVARCSVGTIDLGGNLVRDGWALDWPRYSNSEYRVQQVEAEGAMIGAWSGPFDAPWDWRKSHSEEAGR